MPPSPTASGTALLVMDIMPIVTPAFGGGDDLITHINVAIDAARSASMPVLFGRVVFRPGYPEVSSMNQLFTSLAGSMDFTEENPASQLHPELHRSLNDLVFVKRRVSSFAGSDLDTLLRGLAVDTLVLSGVATSGVVLSTVRAAADLDYRLTVLEDCCGDRDADVHQVLMTKVFPAQATVLHAEEWAATV